MIKKLAALVLCLCLLSGSVFAAAEDTPVFSHQEIAELALFELEVDGPFGDGDRIRTGDGFRTIIHRWPDPEDESVFGEMWYVRFDALDKVNDRSYIIGLNEDGELRWMNVEPAQKECAGLQPVPFAELRDWYIDKHGPMTDWNQAVFMSFATESRKGKPETRHAWRFQQASFVPVPEDAISRGEAYALAAEAIDFPVEAAAMCVCLEDGDRAIYKVSFSYGHGWEYMVELDCRTGEVLKTIPFESGTHGWSDCCVPDSITQAVPPAEDFLTNG